MSDQPTTQTTPLTTLTLEDVVAELTKERDRIVDMFDLLRSVSSDREHSISVLQARGPLLERVIDLLSRVPATPPAPVTMPLREALAPIRRVVDRLNETIQRIHREGNHLYGAPDIEIRAWARAYGESVMLIDGAIAEILTNETGRNPAPQGYFSAGGTRYNDPAADPQGVARWRGSISNATPDNTVISAEALRRVSDDFSQLMTQHIVNGERPAPAYDHTAFTQRLADMRARRANNTLVQLSDVVKAYTNGTRDFSRLLFSGTLKRTDSSGIADPLQLDNCDFSHSDFSGAEIIYTTFINCDFMYANLESSTLTDVTLNHCSMGNVNLANKNWRRVELKFVRDLMRVYIPDMSERGEELYVVKHDNRVMVSAGCFWGSLVAFTNRVIDKKPPTHIYRDVISLVAKVWPEIADNE